MNISRTDIDSLNAVVTVAIKKEDYADKVHSILNNYRKTANIPGFRKGHVPMGMVKRQFGKGVLLEEVNKILQDSLHKYLIEEKLDVLGNPLPKNEETIDWEADDFNFEFELGLAPKFEVDLQGKKAITAYKIVADDTMIDNQVKSIRKQYGKLISKTEVGSEDEITGTFTNSEKEINSQTTFALDRVSGKKQLKQLVGAKVGDVVELKTKGLFKEEHDLQHFLKVTPDDSKDLDITVSLAIAEVNEREMAEMNQELFDKLFGEGLVKTEAELKEKIKEDAERQFEQQSDQKLLNDVIESLLENTTFDLPDAFLQRWMAVAGEEPLTQEQAAEQYEASKKGLRYQLIEGKLKADHNLNVEFEELKAYANDMIRGQMAQFGQTNPSDEELDGIAARILSNQDEVKRIQEQLSSQKMLTFFKENAKLKTKEVTYEKFIKEAYN